MAKLNTVRYVAFPFALGADGPATALREDHVKQQIQQVLFTNPGERVFRPEFGAGLRALVHEPNASSLWEVTRKRMLASLAEALQGEVDPKTLEVDVRAGDDESQLIISIRYQLTTLGYVETHAFSLEG